MNRALAVACIRLGCALAVLSGLIGAAIVAEEFLPFAIAFSLFLVGPMALLFAVDVAKIAGASPSPGGLRRALVAFASFPQIALGAAALLSGVAVVPLVLYNLFVERVNSLGDHALLMVPLLIPVGIHWIREGLGRHAKD
jgi:hypothetical protein